MMTNLFPILFLCTVNIQFVNNGGSSYIDSDNVRYISLDYTLFVEGGEDPTEGSQASRMNQHALYPLRHTVCLWLDSALKDAQEKVSTVRRLGL